MNCSLCHAETGENAVCRTCNQNERKHVLTLLENFVDANYPSSQYKTFNSRFKAKLKEILEPENEAVAYSKTTK